MQYPSSDPRPAAKAQVRRSKEEYEMHHRLAAFPPVRMGSWRRYRSASQELADMMLAPAPSSIVARKPMMSVRSGVVVAFRMLQHRHVGLCLFCIGCAVSACGNRTSKSGPKA